MILTTGSVEAEKSYSSSVALLQSPPPPPNFSWLSLDSTREAYFSSKYISYPAIFEMP